MTARLALVVALLAAGCTPLVPPRTAADVSPCAWERAAVEATSGAVAALDAAVRGLPGDAAEEVRTAVEAARAVVEMGRAAVRLCDDAVSRPQWWTWAGSAMRALGSVVELFSAGEQCRRG
jgi:hypothetical protein